MRLLRLWDRAGVVRARKVGHAIEVKFKSYAIKIDYFGESPDVIVDFLKFKFINM